MIYIAIGAVPPLVGVEMESLLIAKKVIMPIYKPHYIRSIEQQLTQI